MLRMYFIISFNRSINRGLEFPFFSEPSIIFQDVWCKIGKCNGNAAAGICVHK